MGLKEVKARHKMWGAAEFGGIISSLPSSTIWALKIPAKIQFADHKKKTFRKLAR